MTATPIADLIERLLAAGLPHASVVDSVRTIEGLGLVAQRHGVTSRATLSETPGAIRSRRWRAKHQQNQPPAEANDAAAQPSRERHAQRHGETGAVVLSSTSFENGIREVKKEGVARARGTRISEDWQPDAERCEFARGLGLDPAAVRDEFVDFWFAVPGSRGLKLDWQKTFKNRCREVAGRRGGRVNGTHAPRPGSKEDTRERTVNALRDLKAFANSDDEAGSRETDQQVSGLLPFAKPA